MAGCGAATAAKVFLKKIHMAPCRASIRLPFPTSPETLRAPRHDRRAGNGVARGELYHGFRRCAAYNQIDEEPDS
jgi:hypothetical protein